MERKTPPGSEAAHGRESAINDKLDILRENIDQVDSEIVSMIAKRQKIVGEVIALKKAHDIPVYHPAREEDLISERRRQGRKAGLSPDFLEEVFRSIIRQSRKIGRASCRERVCHRV